MPLEKTPVVTCFLRHRGEVLLVRRSGEVGSYQGRWGGVAGYAEGDPDEAARREIHEETGLSNAVELVRRGEAFSVRDDSLGKRWIVHPYLFDCSSRDVRLDWESVEADWVSPTEILRRETVPELWRSYDAVAPSVDSLREDREHGSAYLSIRAVEVLRDRGGRLAVTGGEESAWAELVDLAERLLVVRPSMVALANRVYRVMHAAATERTAGAVEHAAREVIRDAFEQDDAAARRASEIVCGRRVATLSRSGTVLEALLSARPPPFHVVVAESRPGGEGAGVAERLERARLAVTLVPDAALAAAMESSFVELAVVGADAILPSGGVVNKTGTKLLALAARDRPIPFYVVSAEDKISPEEEVDLSEPAPASEPKLQCPLFERTEARLVEGIVLADSLCQPSDIAGRAERIRALRKWRDDGI